MTAIIDYNAGNLTSVALAFAALALSKLTTKDATARANTSAAAIIEQKKRAAEQAIVKE